ncbi:MAG: cysteine desulfurase [Bdellovibrionales bacterium]|nr:cysteine desulfurase [Bdellovibrionales bacterium]
MTPKPLSLPIYMDHNATTPLDPSVREAMRPYLEDSFGNASSASHAYGWQAQSAVKKAREQVAHLLGCRAGDIVWTSGATESNNLAILGVVRAYCKEKPHIITQATEHKAVLEVCEAGGDWGADTTVLPVNAEGLISIDDLRKAIRPNTVMVSIMMANNEVGALQPVEEIAKICREHKLIFHTDAAQSVGKYKFDLHSIPADLVSLSGHKLYGPKGIGALVVRALNREFTLKPILFGGDQEKKLRPGTLNVSGIVGLGAACETAAQVMQDECTRLQAFQTRVLKTLRARFPQVKLNGPPEGQRLCNNISLSFPDLHADDMALDLSGIAFSSGSACNSASAKPSHVLKAMGVSDPMARATLRLGMGRFTTESEVSTVIDKVLKMLEKAYASR